MDLGDSLISLVQQCKWDEILKYVESQSKPKSESKSFPNETATTAHIIPATTNKILLYACRSIAFHKIPPINFIEKLLQAKPRFVTNGIGEFNSSDSSDPTPLHLLLHYRTHSRLRVFRTRENTQLIEDIGLLIIETDPNSLLHPLKSTGFLPLHSLLNNCLTFHNSTRDDCYEGLLYNDQDETNDNNKESQNFFEKILTANPQCLIFPNKGHVTCFQMFWNAFCTTYDDIEHCDKLLLCPKTAQWYYYEYHMRKSRRRNNANKESADSINTNKRVVGTFETSKERYTKNMYSCFIAVIQLAALATCKMANQNNSNIDDRKQINLDNDDKYEVNGEDKRESRMPLFLPLHSVISIPCAPIDMIKFVLSVHGNREIRMLDSQGNTPLHKAIEVITITVNINDNVNIDATTTISTTMATRNKQTVQRSQEDTKQIIQMLLKTDSNLASIQNGQGYFPFFLALEQHGTLGWDDGVCFLLDAYPEVMSYNDPVFHFNPFIYSALPICVGTDNDHNSSLPNDGIEQRKRQISKLNISYQLLRKYPNLIFV